MACNRCGSLSKTKTYLCGKVDGWSGKTVELCRNCADDFNFPLSHNKPVESDRATVGPICLECGKPIRVCGECANIC